MNLVRVSALAVLTLLLTACASTPPRSTEPADRPSRPAQVPDALPRVEPRSSHGNPPFYDVSGRRYLVLSSADGFLERGVASWYGADFHGHNTSSGERYDMYAMTAAHKTLPIPCYARITNLANGRSIVVRINDRGPFVANRIVDLSYSAAMRLDIVRTGTALVELRTIAPGPEPAPTAPLAGQPSTPAPAALYIQVGAYGDQGNAQKVIDRLQSAGVGQVFSLVSTSGSRLLRRVRIGPIATVEQFDQLAARLAVLGYPEAQLAND